MRSRYSSKELAKLLNVTVQTIINWAKKERWCSTARNKLGGGSEWLVESMPETRRKQLTIAFATHKAQQEYTEAQTPKVKKATIQSMAGLSEYGIRKAEAKKVVVNIVTRIQQETGAGITHVLEDFVSAYRKRQAGVEAWVYEALPNISRCSIRNWMLDIEKDGLRGLARKFEKRGPTNIISTNPVLETFVLGLIETYPSVTGVNLHRAIVARFGKGGIAYNPEMVLPEERTVQRWWANWKKSNKQLHQHMLNPDQWRSHYKLALGDASAHITRLNQEWQADSTVCDLMLNDGRRHCIVAMIDVYSRRVMFHVSRTSTSAAVASCYRKALLAWGVNEVLKTDNGADYLADHMRRIINFLDVHHIVCPPFTPEHKPHVERLFKTFLHSIIELMQGYVGHSVAERKDIEARKSFAERLYDTLTDKEARLSLNVSPEELQRVCDAWATTQYGDSVHGSLDGKTPNQKGAEYSGVVERIEDERALDVLLLPCPGNNGIRTVTKKGIRITSKRHGLNVGGNYVGNDLGVLQKRKVLVRMDDTDLGRVYLFDPVTNDYLGKAENPGLLGWTDEDMQKLANSARRTQNTVINKERKKTKLAAKKAKVENIAHEIIQTAVNRHTPLEPKEQTVTFVNKSLEQAARVFTGDFTPPTPEQHAKVTAPLVNAPEPQAQGFVVPRTDHERVTLWQALYEQYTVDASTLSDEEKRWFKSFAKSENCKAHCFIHSISIEALFKKEQPSPEKDEGR